MGSESPDMPSHADLTSFQEMLLLSPTSRPASFSLAQAALGSSFGSPPPGTLANQQEGHGSLGAPGGVGAFSLGGGRSSHNFDELQTQRDHSDRGFFQGAGRSGAEIGELLGETVEEDTEEKVE